MAVQFRAMTWMNVQLTKYIILMMILGIKNKYKVISSIISMIISQKSKS